MNLLIELFKLFRIKKKLWLLPLVLVMVLIALLLLLAQSSIIAPFIYTLI